MEEIKHLKDAPELSTREEMPKVALIRPNNMVFYKRNRYQMPYGTYAPNRNARIEVDDAKKQVTFYDSQTGEFLEKLPLSEGIGRAVRNTHPERNRTAKHKELLFAVQYCTERGLYTATDYKDTLEYFASKKDAPKEHLPPVKLPAKYRMVIADVRPLQVYSSLVKAGESK